MTTYKELFGKAVKYLSTDPDNAQAEGQVWYNSTSGTFKSIVVGAAWSSSGGLGTARYALGKGTTGTQTASIAALGRISTGATGVTEEYNGSGWSTGGTANTARYAVGCFGTQTALVVAGGTPPAQQTVEEYNGSTWTTGTSIPSTARSYLAGFGIETAGAVFGGGSATPVDTVFTTTDEYNGSSWTAGGSLNTGRNRIASTGTLTAGIAATGAVLPFNTASGAAEQYDGTSWTTVTSVNTARYNTAGFGIQTATVIAGGTPSPTATETWDGSSWTTSPATLGTGRNAHSAGGNSGTAGLVFGGNPPGISNTEEYNVSASIITAAAWSSGGNMNTGREGLSGQGLTIDTALATGGGTATTSPGATEEYDGSSWTTTGTMNTGRSFMGSAGIQTAAVVFGGTRFNPPASTPGGTEEYNGSTWTAGNVMTRSPAMRGIAGSGTQTAAIGTGGFPVTNTNSEEYDGSSWTTGNATNTARRNATQSGPSAGALLGAGFYTNNTESYDGTSWTTTPAVNTHATGEYANSRNNSTSLILTFGDDEADSIYDGTTWVTAAALGTPRPRLGGAGTATSALAFGGPGSSTATEEFTGETSALNYKTITTS
jgi:hypothetical protein